MMAADQASSARELVGLRVQQRRSELGMNLTDLVRAAEVHHRTVRDLEQGHRWPRDSTRFKIEKALDWEPGTLRRMVQEIESGGEPSTAPQPEEVDVPVSEAETAARLVLALDEVYARLHSTVLSEQVLQSLPTDDGPGSPRAATQQMVEYLDYASMLAETLAASLAGSGEELARLKRIERARMRSLSWAPPSADHVAELEARKQLPGR